MLIFHKFWFCWWFVHLLGVLVCPVALSLWQHIYLIFVLKFIKWTGPNQHVCLYSSLYSVCKWVLQNCISRIPLVFLVMLYRPTLSRGLYTLGCGLIHPPHTWSWPQTSPHTWSWPCGPIYPHTLGRGPIHPQTLGRGSIHPHTLGHGPNIPTHLVVVKVYSLMYPNYTHKLCPIIIFTHTVLSVYNYLYKRQP